MSVKRCGHITRQGTSNHGGHGVVIGVASGHVTCQWVVDGIRPGHA